MPKTPTAAEFRAARVNVPSDMLTRDWDRVQPAVRERAFFMASVVEHEILDAFREGAEALAAGTVSPARAAEITRERLVAMGYEPKPGTEGSIKDLTSWRRLKVTLGTNAAMVAGQAGYARMAAAVELYPAKQMVRLVAKKEPRNWPVIWWQKAAQVPAEGVNVAEKAAHIFHPVWRSISRFGLPYPPYDFGSGMGDKALRIDKAEALGVATLPPPAEPGTATPAVIDGVGPLVPSMNADLVAKPDIRTEVVRTSLTRQLKGTAEWDGDQFIYRDPNGTRPGTPEAIAEVIQQRPFAGAPVYQLEAARAFVQEGADAFSAGSDLLYDMARLVHRVQPMDIAPVLWSGRGFASEDALTLWLSSLEGGRAADRGFPWLVCGLEALQALTQIDVNAAVAVVFSIRRARGVRDLRPALMAAGAPETMPGLFIEPGAKYQIVSEAQDRGVRLIVLEEVAP